jgi:hypothetical protein
MGATEIAKALKIGRASVYRVLEGAQARALPLDAPGLYEANGSFSTYNSAQNKAHQGSNEHSIRPITVNTPPRKSHLERDPTCEQDDQSCSFYVIHPRNPRHQLRSKGNEGHWLLRLSSMALRNIARPIS